MFKLHAHAALALLFAASLLVMVGCGGGTDPGQTAGSGGRVPVVLITLDGFASERLAAFDGAQPAPALERLIGEGAAWTDAWTACPMTRPAVATYLTGLTPDIHGVRDDLFSPLDERWPSLATTLSAAGYHTAAFPDSSFLGKASGLAAGFGAIDDPPALPVGPDRWIPVLRDPVELADHFGLWLQEIPDGDGYFAWLHFSGMMRAQFIAESGSLAVDGPFEERMAKKGVGPQKDDSKSAEDRRAPIEAIDAAIGQVLAALELRGDSDRALILVAGTSATFGGEDAIGGRGPGFSLDERSIRVPVIARFPDGAGTARSADQPVWAPDVPATIAQVAGVDLPPEAEGVSLLGTGGEARTLFAWSWATLDQMGWLPLRAAREGEWKRMEGWDTVMLRLDGAEADADEATTQALSAAIRSRGEPERSTLDPYVLDGWIREQGLNLDPAPAGGRDLGSAEKRSKAARLLWRGRTQFVIQRPRQALAALGRVLETDPLSIGAMIDRGQLLTLTFQQEEALPLLRQAVERYPHNTEAWHWLAHAIWQTDSWEQAAPVLEAILPFQPYDADVLYDLACTNSLAGDLERSADFLGRAIQAGFTRWDHIAGDSDLRNLRESALYSEVMRTYGP